MCRVLNKYLLNEWVNETKWVEIRANYKGQEEEQSLNDEFWMYSLHIIHVLIFNKGFISCFDKSINIDYNFK